jgi:hypothetical protein
VWRTVGMCRVTFCSRWLSRGTQCDVGCRLQWSLLVLQLLLVPLSSYDAPPYLSCWPDCMTL